MQSIFPWQLSEACRADAGRQQTLPLKYLRACLLAARATADIASGANLIARMLRLVLPRLSFFPQISLTGWGGGFGRSSFFSSLMSSKLESGLWRSGKSAIFTGGALRGNCHSRIAAPAGSARYKQTIQRAFGDVPILIAYQNSMRWRIQQEQLVADLDESVALQHAATRAAPPLIWKCWTAKGLCSPRNSLCASSRNEYQSLVQIYRALGGGWQQ